MQDAGSWHGLGGGYESGTASTAMPSSCFTPMAASPFSLLPFGQGIYGTNAELCESCESRGPACTHVGGCGCGGRGWDGVGRGSCRELSQAMPGPTTPTRFKGNAGPC